MSTGYSTSLWSERLKKQDMEMCGSATRVCFSSPVLEQGRGCDVTPHISRYISVTLGSPSGVACRHICMGSAC